MERAIQHQDAAQKTARQRVKNSRQRAAEPYGALPCCYPQPLFLFAGHALVCSDPPLVSAKSTTLPSPPFSTGYLPTLTFKSKLLIAQDRGMFSIVSMSSSPLLYYKALPTGCTKHMCCLDTGILCWNQPLTFSAKAGSFLVSPLWNRTFSSSTTHSAFEVFSYTKSYQIQEHMLDKMSQKTSPAHVE